MRHSIEKRINFPLIAIFSLFSSKKEKLAAAFSREHNPTEGEARPLKNTLKGKSPALRKNTLQGRSPAPGKHPSREKPCPSGIIHRKKKLEQTAVLFAEESGKGFLRQQRAAATNESSERQRQGGSSERQRRTRAASGNDEREQRAAAASVEAIQKIDSSDSVVSSSSIFMPMTELPLPLSRGLQTATA